MAESEKWITVQIWRRKRKKGTSYALRYGDRQRPTTVGLGRCTEEYAELRRAELEQRLNALPDEVKTEQTQLGRLSVLLVRRGLTAAGYGPGDIQKILGVVIPHLQR